MWQLSAATPVCTDVRWPQFTAVEVLMNTQHICTSSGAKSHACQSRGSKSRCTEINSKGTEAETEALWISFSLQQVLIEQEENIDPPSLSIPQALSATAYTTSRKESVWIEWNGSLYHWLPWVLRICHLQAITWRFFWPWELVQNIFFKNYY